MKPNIELHIDELVLRGLPYAQRRRIVAAIEVELTRLLGEQGLPETWAQGGTLPQIKIDTMHMADGAKPQAIGAQIARQVYGNLVGRNADHRLGPRV